MQFQKLFAVALFFFALFAQNAHVAEADFSKNFKEDLMFGSEGESVRRLQTILSRDQEIYPEGIVSGWFGPLTREAVVRFQRRHGIEPDGGFFGPLTRAKMNALLAEAGEALAFPVIAEGGEKARAPLTAVFESGTTASIVATSSLAVLLHRPEKEHADRASNAEPPEQHVSIADAEARHSCAIEPFSRTIAYAQDGDYAVTLTPSVRAKHFTLFTSSLPAGIEAVFNKTDGNPHIITLTLDATDSATPGSFNAMVIYEEAQDTATALRNFCQFHIVVH